MLFFLANSSLMEFQVGYSTLLHLFSVLDSFTWFWMECICKIIQLILEFLKTPFIVFHFFNYTFFFICYLAASRPTLSHCQGDSLTNPMLITEFMILISTQRSPSLIRGWVPKPGHEPRGVWTRNFPISDLLDDLIYNIANCADNTTLYSKCDHLVCGSN